MIRLFRRAALSILLCLALSAFGATLPSGNWHEPVRIGLQRAIDRHVGDPDAYAVFDFDNTCAIGDSEHTVLGHLIDTLSFAFTPDELPDIFLEGMPDPGRPLEPGKESATARNVVLDCADLYRELLELKAHLPMKELRKTDAFAAFAAKMRYLRKRISRTFGSGFGYPWGKRFYSRMTSEQARNTVRAALDAAVADGRFIRSVWRTPATRAGRSGCVEVPMYLGFSVPQEIKDLVRTLKESGIAVYIVSGSFQEVVSAGSDGRYGITFPAENVFGIHMKHDAKGRIAGWADDRFPLPWAEGKPDVIRRTIENLRDVLLIAAQGQCTVHRGIEVRKRLRHLPDAPRRITAKTALPCAALAAFQKRAHLIQQAVRQNKENDGCGEVFVQQLHAQFCCGTEHHA